jgi:lipoate-protein ligase A
VAEPWRLIVDRNSYADFSVSVSPAVEKAVIERASPPTVYLTVFDSDSVTVGVNEDPEQVLDLEFCRANRIRFLRRVSGGGAVYAGAGSAFLVLFLRTDDARVPATAREAFPFILGRLAEVFRKRYGFPAAYRPLNDIEVEGRKLVPCSLKIESGIAVFRIVINVKPIDTGLAGRALPMPPEKVQDKALKDLASRYTWLEREAGRAIDAAELEALSRQFVAHSFGDQMLTPGALSAAERADADMFRRRYDCDAWLYGKNRRTRLDGLLRPGDSTGTGRCKAMGGMIWATLALRGGTVLRAIVNGDWHPRPIDSVGWLEDSLAGAPADSATLRDRIAAFLARPDVEFAGVTADDLGTALDKALAGQVADMSR